MRRAGTAETAEALAARKQRIEAQVVQGTQDLRGALDDATSEFPNLADLGAKVDALSPNTERFKNSSATKPWYTRLANWFSDLPSAISKAFKDTWDRVSALFSGAASSSASSDTAPAPAHGAAAAPDTPAATAVDRSRDAALAKLSDNAAALESHADAFKNRATTIAANAEANNDAPEWMQRFPLACRFFEFNPPADPTTSTALLSADPAAVIGADSAARAASELGGGSPKTNGGR